MIELNDVLDALTKCSGYDPGHFSVPSKVVASAWCEYFEDFPSLRRDDLLAAVKLYYRTPDRKVPQPADIGDLARKLRRDEIDREDESDRDARALANDKRLGLPTDWHHDERALPSVESQEQRAESLRTGVSEILATLGNRTAIQQANRDEYLRKKAQEQRAAAPPSWSSGPPQAQSPQEPPKVSEEGSQPPVAADSAPMPDPIIERTPKKRATRTTRAKGA